MAKFLFAAIPAYGHVNPTLAIAQQLIAQGHEVLYACHTHFRSVIEKAGIPFADDFSWGDGSVLYNEIMTEGRQKEMNKLFQERLGISNKRSGFYDLEGGTARFIALIDQWKPDVCYIDSLFFPGTIACEARNVPFAFSVATPLAMPSMEYVPYEKGKRMNIFKRLVIWVLLRGTDKWMTAEVNNVRRKFNVPPVKSFRHPVSPSAYLLYSSGAFEFDRQDLYPQTFYIGPSISKNLTALIRSSRGIGLMDVRWCISVWALFLLTRSAFSR